MTGERPVQEATPDSVLALHSAGYREVEARIGTGLVLDLGCGLGFESVRLIGPDRKVIGIDYDHSAALNATQRFGNRGFRVMQMDCSRLGIKSHSVDWVSSSHLIEHFYQPAGHVAEIARIMKYDGTGFILTPNKPSDFENPFHVVLFDRDELFSLLSQHFEDVWVGGLDATQRVKDEIAERRAKASKVYAVDKFGLRHKMPRSWWIWAYTRLLPLGQKVIYRSGMGGLTGITDEEFFKSDTADESTPVLFAVFSKPKIRKVEY
ncbi:MAG: class I SAM-dependent methyltransferase [Acidimicrobiales bacterium]|nr:class I SAM-dependent methyltransferase [Acidimicrobiales bacterium]